MTVLPSPPGDTQLSLASANEDDFESLLALRMAALRESLQRLGRFDPQRARERLSRAFEPVHTRHILRNGDRMGPALSAARRVDSR